jgi:hypothetical protein
MFQKLVLNFGIKIERERERESKRPPLNFLLKSIFSVLFIVLFFFLFNASAYAATYYVDPSITDINPASATPDYTTYDHTTFATTGGTDSVYKTIADVNLKVFVAGDSVLFRKGGTWREQLTVPSSGSVGSPITFSAYGSGNNPQIMQTDSYSNWWEGLIPNGSFEGYTGTIDDGVGDTFDGWTASSDVIAKVEAVSDSYTGNTAAKFTKLNPSSTSSALLKFFPTTLANTTYYFEFYAKRNAGTGTNACRVSIKDINNNNWLYENGTWGPNLDDEINNPTSLRATESAYTLKSKSFTTQTNGTNLQLTFAPKYNQIATCTWDAVYFIEGTTKSSVGVWSGFDPIAARSFGLISNGSRVPYVNMNSGANPLTIPNGYFYEASNSSTFYYRNDAGNPGAKEVGARKYGIYISGKSYVTIDGIDVYGVGGNQVASSSIGVGIEIDHSSHDITIQNGTISYGVQVGIWAESNTSNIIYNNLLVHDNQNTGLYMRGDPGGTIENSKIYDNGQITGDAGDMGGIGINGGNITISGNEVYNNGPDNGDADFEISVVPTIGTLGPITIIKNYVHDCSQGCVQVSEGGNGSTISYNLINGFGTSTYSGESWGKFSGIRVGGGASGAANVKIYNNVIANGSSTAGNQKSGIAIRFPESTGTQIKNNIFYNNGGAEISVNASVTDTTTHSYNNNDYYRSDYTNAWNWKGTNYSSLVTWKAASSQDSNSLILDPKFVSGSDFHLLPSSPAINAGVDVGLTSDYAGTSVPQGSAPDMGAYEYLLPLSPSALVQYLSDGVTVLTTGAATKSANVDFSMSMSSTNSADTLLTPKIEIEPIGTAFTNTSNYSGSGVAYSGTPVTGTIAVTGLADGNYHWQASASNSAGTGNWVSYGGNSESATDFTIDTTPPGAPGTPMPTPSSPTNSTTQNWVWSAATDAVSGVANYVYRVLDSLSNVVASGTTTATNLITNLTQGVYTFFVKAVDNVGNQGSESQGSLTVDTTAPTGGSITYTNDYYTSASVSLTASDGTDTGGSNINTSSRIVQRKSATLTNGTCGSYGSFGTITPTGSYPNYTDTTVTSSTCYQYQYLVSDNASNQATYTSSNTVFVLSLPLSASSLAQYQSDGTTGISSGSTLGVASTVVLKFSMSSTNSSDTLTPQVEIQRQDVAFTNTPNYSGSALSFTGTPVTGTVTIPSMGGGNYHWQARVINSAGQSSWVAMGGNPDFSVEFPPAANNSSAPSGCSNQAPTSSPDLFQVDTINTKATVYFAPSGMPYDNYVIRFGLTANNLLYSASFTRGYAGGVIYYTINELNPNTIYYFQVRAGNGCKPGEWGNTLSAKTTGSIKSTSKSYKSLGGFIKSLLSSLSPKYTGSAINNSTSTTANNSTPKQCTQYTVLGGDSFWTIAQKLLGSGKRYLEIWKANINTYPTLKNSPVIRAGWKLSVGC